jgi:nitrite reductase (NO-forming)
VSAPRGAPGRAAAAQRDAWRTLRIAGAFLAAALLAGVLGGHAGTWAALHLLLLGGVLSAISAATQLFAVTWSASPAPPTVLVALQRWLLAVGAVVVVVGRHREAHAAVTGAGGTAVLTALGLLGWILWQVRRHAVTDRFAPAIDAYLLAIGLGVVGSAVGVAMASAAFATTGGAREAHIVLNLFGLVGLVVLGTLPTFVATQVRAKVSGRATSTRLRRAALLMAGSTVVAVGGLTAEQGLVAAVGFLGYAMSALAVIALLPNLGPKQRRWAGPRLAQLLAALGWWVLAAVWAAAWSLDLAAGDRLWLLLGVGGYGQLVVASLAYLGPILRGRDHEAQARAFRITRSWLSVTAGNLVALAILVGWWQVTVVAAVVWALDVAVRAVLLVLLVRPTPLASNR